MEPNSAFSGFRARVDHLVTDGDHDLTPPVHDAGIDVVTG